MIYSVPKPGGGFEYYETQGEHFIGDDLPPVRFSPVNDIGTPAFEVGRKTPAGARRVGSGVIPKGTITPMRSVRFSAFSGFSAGGATNYTLTAMVGVGVGVLGYYLVKRR